MNPIFTFWLVIGLAVILSLGGLVAGILRILFGEELHGADSLWFFAFLAGILFGAFAYSLSDGPGLYTRQVGSPVAATISHLTFLNGALGSTDWVRVDTDRGVYMLHARALVPASGTIFIVQRKKTWNQDERTFLCLKATPSVCWATVSIDP